MWTRLSIFFCLLFSQISFSQSKLLGENCQMEVGSGQLSEMASQSTNQNTNTMTWNDVNGNDLPGTYISKAKLN